VSTRAPLIATPLAPIPQGADPFWYSGAGGARLRAAIFPPLASPRGSVVLSAGRAEPIEKYFEVVGELQGRGFAVLAHDWRGQGLSLRLLPDRLRGHAQGHGVFLEDFRRLLEVLAGRLARPWIGMGHSMGGALTALAQVTQTARFDALFLTAPMMGLAAVRRLPPAAWIAARAMVGAGRGGDYVLKGGFDPMLSRFEGNILTHDAARYARFKAQLAACPDLALGGITWGWLSFAMDAGIRLAWPSAARGLTAALTVVGAGDERLVLNGPARRFAEAAPHGCYVEIAGALHEVLMETDPRRALVWREFDALAARIPPNAPTA
jgi:lysophospholipase